MQDCHISGGVVVPGQSHTCCCVALQHMRTMMIPSLAVVLIALGNMIMLHNASWGRVTKLCYA